ncbi:hypothetical protein ABB37_10142, partial [Leptomonas pyrrhocoris]
MQSRWTVAKAVNSAATTRLSSTTAPSSSSTEPTAASLENSEPSPKPPSPSPSPPLPPSASTGRSQTDRSPFQFRAGIRAQAAREVLDVAHSTPTSLTHPHPSTVTAYPLEPSGKRKKRCAADLSACSSPSSPPCCSAAAPVGVVSEDAVGSPASNGRLSRHCARTRAPQHSGETRESVTGAIGQIDVVAADDNDDGSSRPRWVADIPFIGEACEQLARTAVRLVPPGGHLSN